MKRPIVISKNITGGKKEYVKKKDWRESSGSAWAYALYGRLKRLRTNSIERQNRG